MPCPHFSIGIVSRGSGGSSHSCTDSASYQSGEKIYSEYEGTWHSGKHTERIAHTDILLPPNAPEEYRDRSTLRNAVDASEKSSVAQTARRIIIALPRELSLEDNIALITEYCQEQFVEKGMIADIAVHEEHDGNPHAHIMLTVRAIDENGKWLPKTKTSYLLDENGERVLDANGKPKRIRKDTVDWNCQDKAEIWRQAWEKKQNEALEKAGCSERVDMRSYRRQGIDKIPQRHMGPAVTAMERKGVGTEIGNQNQEISNNNQLLANLHRMLEMIINWLNSLMDLFRSIETIENPEEKSVRDLLAAYRDLRIKDLTNDAAFAVSDDTELIAFDNALAFVKELNIETVDELAIHINDVNQNLISLHDQVQATEIRLQDIDAIIRADQTIQDVKPIFEEYRKLHWENDRKIFREKHGAEMSKALKAKDLLKKLQVSRTIDKNVLKNEASQLTAKLKSAQANLDNLKQQMKRLQNLRNCIRKVIPNAMPFKTPNDKVSFREIAETANNQKNLDRMMDRATDREIRPKEALEIKTIAKPKERE